jgi:molybdopterin/thiamine biosynthesis adenylyltransferase
MSERTKLAELLSAHCSDGDPCGALVLPPAITALAREATSSRRALFGSILEETGHVRVFVTGLEPSAGAVRVGELGDGDDPPSAEEVRLTPGPRPRACFGGRPLEIITGDPERYRDRISALPGADALGDKTVALAGLGSVGSLLGAQLVRIGVRVVAFDPDILTVENLVRWGLPIELEKNVGRTKAAVWSEHLTRAVPHARVEAHGIDVVRNGAAFDRAIRGHRPDLLIAATDTNDSRRAVNAAAAEHELTALFVGLSDGAAGVRIEVVEDARRGPCHLCAMSAEGVSLSGARTRTPYSSAEAAVQPAGIPALPIDVSLGASFAAKVAVELLAGRDWRNYFRNGDQAGNVLFLSLGPEYWIFDSPWEKMVYSPERDPDCPCCRDREGSYA